DSGWLRTTEKHAPGTQSVFKFDVQGSVAKSTHEEVLTSGITFVILATKKEDHTYEIPENRHIDTGRHLPGC
ncbi:MAG: hypothetical protein Q8O44_03195, partial [Syntrophales bacterium]|nr:hypothetical protein [Syntrophales bacterium]